MKTIIRLLIRSVVCRSRNRSLAVLAIVAAVFFPAILTAQAQGANGVEQLPKPLTPDAVRDMVARMGDDQVRAMLLDRLDAVARAEADAKSILPSFTDTILETWVAFYTPLVHAVRQLPLLFSEQAEAFSNFGAAFGSSGLVGLFSLFAVSVTLGWVAKIIARKMLGTVGKSHTAPQSAPVSLSFATVANSIWVQSLGLAVFYVVARVICFLLMTTEQLSIAVLALNFLLFVPLLMAGLSRCFIAPYNPALRVVSLTDHWARYIHRNLIGFALLSGATLFLVEFNASFGVPVGETMLGAWLVLAQHIYIVVIAWKARDGLTQMMLGTDPDRTKADEWIAVFYPYFAIMVSVAVWMLTNIVAGIGQYALLLKGPQYTTMFWLLMIPIVDTAIRGLVTYSQPPMIGNGEIAERAHISNKRSLIRIARVLALGFMALVVAGAWGVNLFDLSSAGVGRRFAGKLIEFTVTCALGYVVYEIASLWINRRLAREMTKGGLGENVAGEIGGASGSRLATVLPLVLVTVRIAIIVMFGLLALGSLGVDITPLLAGAGIIGIAIGFGAQKLVTDVVSGVFFLIDDAFRIGEYVDVGGTKGTVEKTSIRSMQLRHHRGNVHTIPYSSIEKVTNFSRDWVITKLMFTVPFNTDPDKVRRIFKKIGIEMMEDPLFKNDFLEPFKSQGVFEFNDVGIVIRGKFMAKPGTQFMIRKEILNRVGSEFKANGIEFARREVRVAMPDAENYEGYDNVQKSAVGAAAVSAIQASSEKVEEDQKKDG